MNPISELPIDTQNNMPLSASSVFASVSAGGNVTPQMALLQTMAAMHQKVRSLLFFTHVGDWVFAVAVHYDLLADHKLET